MKKSTLISALAIFGLVAILPVLWIIADSLLHNGSLSLESYKGVLADNRQITLFKNSLILALGTASLSLAIGVPLAFLVARTNLYFRKYLKYLYLVPLIIPPHVNAIAWIFLLGTKGRLNLLLAKLFSIDGPFFTVYGMKGAILVLGLSYFPIITILAISGLSSMDRGLEEAGMVSSSSVGVVRKITLPLIMPNIMAGAIFVVIFSLSNYGVPALLRLNVYPVEIFARFSAFYDSKGAVALSMPIILITFFLLWLQRQQMKDRPYITLGTGTRTPHPFNLGLWNLPATSFAAVILLLSVVLPMSVLIMESGSFMAYKVAFKTAHRQILTSLILGLTAATLGTVLSFFVSYILERTRWKGKGLIDFLSFAPFAVPAAILGIGLIKTWNRTGTDFIYGSSIIVIFAYVARFSPFAIRAIWANIKQINTSLEEAAVLSNPSWTARILKVLMPLSSSGLLGGWIITFIFCMGELGTTLLVVPPGKATLSIRIYTLMHYGAGNLVASLCLILIAATLLPITFLMLVSAKRRLGRDTSGLVKQ